MREGTRNLILQARIAYMFTGAMQVNAFDAMHAIDMKARDEGDAMTMRHVQRIVKLFDKK